MDRFKYTIGMAIKEVTGEKRILYIDPADYNTHHIYFDSKSLADDDRLEVRDIISGDEITYGENYINIYAAQVEPHRALLESDYFMKLIEMCEICREQEIEAREKQLPVKKEKQLGETDF